MEIYRGFLPSRTAPTPPRCRYPAGRSGDSDRTQGRRGGASTAGSVRIGRVLHVGASDPSRVPNAARTGAGTRLTRVLVAEASTLPLGVQGDDAGARPGAARRETSPPPPPCDGGAGRLVGAQRQPSTRASFAERTPVATERCQEVSRQHVPQRSVADRTRSVALRRSVVQPAFGEQRAAIRGHTGRSTDHRDATTTTAPQPAATSAPHEQVPHRRMEAGR